MLIDLTGSVSLPSFSLHYWNFCNFTNYFATYRHGQFCGLSVQTCQMSPVTSIYRTLE